MLRAMWSCETSGRRRTAKHARPLVMGCIAALHVACTDATPLAPDAPPTSVTAGASCPHGESYQDEVDADLAASIDAFLQPHVDAKEFYGHVLVTRGCAVVVDRGYGFANLPTTTLPGTTPDRDTRYRVGSITKTMTAVAILQLRERGRVDLDAPLHTYLPDFPRTGGKDRITIHHLLTHRSGIPDYLGVLLDYSQPDPYRMMETTWTHRQLLRVFENLPLAFEPGTDFAYSNSNFFLLGLVVESASGKPYAQYFREHIFEPLGMTSSGFGLPADERAADGLVRIMSPTLDGYQVDDVTPGPDMDTTVMNAAGGAYSSPWDLLRFVDSFYSTTLLEQASIDLALTAYSDFDPAAGLQYGYGIGLAGETSPVGTGRWHSGSSHMFKNFWYQTDAGRMTVVINRNISQFEYLPDATNGGLGMVVGQLPLEDVQLGLVQIIQAHYGDD
jgi:CubicO group peptidase (beta-lactamase class C family)